MLMRAATISSEVRGLIADGLRAALGGTHWERGWAGEVQKVIEHLGRELQVSSDVLGLATVKRDPSKALPSEPTADWGGFTRTIDAYAGTVDDAALQAVAAALRNFPSSTKDSGWETKLQVYLGDPDLALITEEALVSVAGARADLVSALRFDVMPQLWRRPISEPS